MNDRITLFFAAIDRIFASASASVSAAGERERRAAPDRRGHDRVHQRGARTVAQHVEHRGLVVGRGADVPRDERVGGFEHGHHASPIVAS